MATAAEQQYQATINRLASNAGMLDPAAVQSALADGGSLSGSLGFNSGEDLMGMTPEQVQQVIQNRGLVQAQNLGLLKGSAELNDMLTGGKEARQMQFLAAGHQFQNASEDERQQQRFDFESKQQKERLAQDWRVHDATLKEQAREHNMNYALGKDRNAQGWEAINQREREMKAITAAGNGVLAGGFKPSDIKGFISVFSEGKEKALAAAQKASGQFHTSPLWKDYHTYALQEASMTSNPGTVYNIGDAGKHFGEYTNYAGQKTYYPQMQLGPDGNWYGIARNTTGKPVKLPGRNTVMPGHIIEVSAQPLVTNPLESLKQAAISRIGARVPTLYHKYDQGDEEE